MGQRGQLEARRVHRSVTRLVVNQINWFNVACSRVCVLNLTLLPLFRVDLLRPTFGLRQFIYNKFLFV